MAKKYIEDKKFYYEMIISKGKGRLTPKAQHYLLLIAKNVIRKKRYNNQDDRDDCIQQGLLHMFQNWSKFNHLKYESPFAYFTELFKRGISEGMNLVLNKKNYREDYIRTISIDSANSGQGLHNI